MAYEVYLGKDNEISILLKENGSAIDIAGSSHMTLKVGNVLFDSTNGATQALRWNGTTYATGEVHICIGMSTALTPRIVRAPLTVYDSTNTNGVMYGTIQLDIRANPESA